MTDNYSHLPGFAKFVLEENLKEISGIYMEKILQIESPLAHPVGSLSKEEQLEYWQSNFRELLSCLASNQGKEYVINMVSHWKQNKLSLLSKDLSALKNLLDSFKIRKNAFFKILPAYTSDTKIWEDVFFELLDFYNFYIEKLVKVYTEIHQDKLILEKEFSQSIINNVVSGISAYDLDWKVTEWNPTLERTYNIPKKEILGKRLRDFFPGYDESDDARAFERVLKGESVSMKDRKYRLRKGWYEVELVPLLNNFKEVVGVLSISHDITRRKEIELKIQEDQHFIKSIADTSPDVITVYDLELQKNIYSSKEIYEILGYSPEELKVLIEKGVQGLIEVIHPEDLLVVVNFLESYKTYTGTQSRDLEYRIKDSQGNYRWILDRYNVFKRSESGLPVQIIGIARDNTLRKTAEDELKLAYLKLHETNEELMRTEELLKEANNELEERVQQRTVELIEKNNQLSRMNADLDNFIYTASHDLKSPAVNLEGLLSLLKKQINEKIDENDEKVMEMIHRSINKLNKTIIDLAEITKAQKDIDGEVERVKFKDILEDVKIDIQSTIDESNAVIVESIEVESILYNKGNLRSILYNLLTNAIKYRSDERKLTISVQTFLEKNQVILCVEDNGLGIAEHQIPKLFTMFKRLHSHVEGTGIGLYIIKRIVENKGGRIEVKSRINEGTLFKVHFPVDTTIDH